jgi:putative transposase
MDRVVPNYPSDLTDAEWETVGPFIPAGRPVGADRRTSMRAVVNAIFYRTRSGCPWRLLPHDFPHWRTVYGYFRQWQQDGTWARIETARRSLRCQWKRLETASSPSGNRSRAQPPSG